MGLDNIAASIGKSGTIEDVIEPYLIQRASCSARRAGCMPRWRRSATWGYAAEGERARSVWGVRAVAELGSARLRPHHARHDQRLRRVVRRQRRSAHGQGASRKRLVASGESLSMKNPAPMATHRGRRATRWPGRWPGAAISAITSNRRRPARQCRWQYPSTERHTSPRLCPAWPPVPRCGNHACPLLNSAT